MNPSVTPGPRCRLPLWFTLLGLVSACAPLKPNAFVRRDGEEVTLAELRGRVVVLNFWAEWCKGCVQEMPALAQAVADSGEGTVLLAAYYAARPRKVGFQRWLDAQPQWFRDAVVWPAESFRAQYDLRVLPLTVVYAADGAEVVRFEGTIGVKQLADAVARAKGAAALSR